MLKNNFVQNAQVSPRVLCWAQIKPNKKGSFEDYLWAMSKKAKRRHWRFILCVLGPVNPQLNLELQDSDCEIVYLTHEQSQNPWHLIKLLHQYKINILHTHFIGPTDFILLMSRCFWEGKIVVTDHSSNPLIPALTPSLVKRKLQTVKRLTFSYCINLYLPVSGFVAQRICSNIPLVQHKVHRLYNGIDLNRFKPCDTYIEKQGLKSELMAFNDDKPIVSFIGQLITEKGIHLCLNVIGKLLKEKKNFHFFIVGDGKQRPLVEAFYKEHPYKEYIHILGSRSDVDDILRITDMLLMPSLWGEAFGLTAAEGIASAVPVIASDIGGIPEIVQHNYNGLLIPTDNENELEMSIKSLLSSPEDRAQMGINGRVHALEYFSLDTMVEQTYAYYETLLSVPPTHLHNIFINKVTSSSGSK